MIEKVTLKNFKCFIDHSFCFSNLTVFAGSNASGKSSVIQALLLLRQSYESKYLEKRQLQLNGKLFSVGTVEDLIMEGEENRTITIGVSENGQYEIFDFEYEGGKRSGFMLPLKKESVPNEIDFLSTSFSYLCAERLGPRNLYEISEEILSSRDVGIQGEYTASILEEFGDEPVKNQDLAGNPMSLKQAIKLWMDKILPGFNYNSNRIIEADKVSLSFATSRHRIRPVNTGFGISYTLPIIVSAMNLPKKSILIIENPEAHLHPAAQSMMGQFLAHAALSGIQLIVETHSDHIINGIRLAIKEKPELSKMAVINSLHTMEGDRENIEIRIDRDGNLDRSPVGFFDQIETDLMRLF